MRNAVIRKKRLKAERIVDDYMRMPQRIITGAEVYLDQQWHTADARAFLVPTSGPEISRMPLEMWR